MPLDPDAKRRWREGLIGAVALRSGRGIAAATFIGLAILLALANPVLVTAAWLQGQEPSSEELTRELLIANFVFNGIILIGLPLLGLLIARPARTASAQQWLVVDERPALNTPAAVLARPPPPMEADTTGQAVIRRLGLQVDARTPLWILLGIGTAIASLLVLGLVVQGLIEIGWMNEEEQESPLIPQIQALLDWPLVLFIPLAASLTEEIFFRGLLQPRFGLIASSAFFGIVHVGYGTVLQVVAPFFLGLLFGILFWRTRSLWAPIAAHYTFDFVQLVALMLTK